MVSDNKIRDKTNNCTIIIRMIHERKQAPDHERIAITAVPKWPIMCRIVLTGKDSGVWSSTYMLFVYPYSIVSRSETQGERAETLNWI